MTTYDNFYYSLLVKLSKFIDLHIVCAAHSQPLYLCSHTLFLQQTIQISIALFVHEYILYTTIGLGRRKRLLIDFSAIMHIIVHVLIILYFILQSYHYKALHLTQNNAMRKHYCLLWLKISFDNLEYWKNLFAATIQTENV